MRLTVANDPRYGCIMTSQPEDARIPDLVSLAGAAAILGKSKQALHRQALNGSLRGRRLDGGSGAWVFRRTYIEQRAAAEKPARTA